MCFRLSLPYQTSLPSHRRAPKLALKTVAPWLQGILQSAWEAISTPRRFVKRDSARSFEDYAFANFGSAKHKLVKTDSAKSDPPGEVAIHVGLQQRTWADYLLCRSPKGLQPTFHPPSPPSNQILCLKPFLVTLKTGRFASD